MVIHRGIGATSASAVVFTVILLSNLAVYLASQDRAQLYSQSNAEDSFGDLATALSGAGAINILLEVQSFLAANAFDCKNAMEAVSGSVGTMSDVQDAGTLTVHTSAQLTPTGPHQDNMSMLAPFDGFVQGDLDLSLSTIASGADQAMGVSYSKAEVHFAHLPVRLRAEQADCTEAVEGISNAIAEESEPNCTYSETSTLLQAASRIPAALAFRDGFTFGLTFSVTRTSPCTVGFVVSIAQVDIRGPGGRFSVGMLGPGTASFGKHAQSGSI